MLDKPSVTPRTVRLHDSDNLVVAVDPISPGSVLHGITARERVPRGHKMAIAPIGQGEPVLKFGQIIGFASKPVLPGEWLHEHNVEMHAFAREYHFAEDAKPEAILPVEAQATFQGFRRQNGKFGTRNYLAILTSVNCSASVARFIAREVERSGILDAYPNIDGVIPLVHGTGCGMDIKGEGSEILKRTQWGYASNPNMAGVLMVGLGCEVFQIGRWKELYGVQESDTFRTMTIQETGGTRKTVDAGLAVIRDMLPIANRAQRETVPASELMLALQCGGSDGYSGITANPALGAAVDLLVHHGGTAILSETPEIYGAEHLLTRRAATREVGEKLVELISRQQGRRPHDDPREVARRRRQGRHDDAEWRLSVCRARDGERLRLHGYAWLRSCLGDRSGSRWRQRPLLHDRTRLRLWLQADAFDQACNQQRNLPSHDRRHGHKLRRHPGWRLCGREGSRDLRYNSQGRIRPAIQIRAARLWRRRIPALASWRDYVIWRQEKAPSINTRVENNKP
jgi:altronate dehydratase